MLKPDLVPNKDFFDSYNEAVLVASREDGIIYVNPCFGQLTGFELEQVADTNLPVILKSYLDKTALRHESYRYLPLQIKSGKVLKLRVSESDIRLTDQREAKLYTFIAPSPANDANTGDGKFYELADASPAMIFLEDTSEQAFYFNKSWLEFTGAPVTNHLGKRWKNIIHPEDLKIAEDHKTEIAGRKSYSCEYRLQKFDGSYRNIFFIRTPVIAEDGTYNGYMTSCLDITEIEETQNKINELTIELNHANEELDQFTYVTSHDLQEPLRMITGYIQLIQKNIERGNLDAIQEFMDFVLSGASRMQMLIADLLKLSRVNRKGAPFAPVRINDVLNVAVTHLDKRIKATGAKIEYGQMPTVTGDTYQLVNLFENILDNALKFTSLNSPPLISVSVTESDGKFIFEVKDNGIGIDNKFHKRIFAIFQRLHTRGEYEGTGIGLAVCKKIVERHGGEIWVESEPGNGSAFYFSIKK